MVDIYIDNTGGGIQWLYDKSNKWKDYVCENFDDHVAIFRSKNGNVCDNAKWYKEARKILDSIENDGCIPDRFDGFDYNWIESFDEEGKNLMSILRFLYPDCTYKYCEITRDDDLDWIECIIDDTVDPIRLCELYFKKIANIEILKSTYKNGVQKIKDIIRYSEYIHAEKNGIKEYFIQKYELSSDEEIHIRRADGYIKVKDWYDVC